MSRKPDFKDWWSKKNIFCGDGGMDAAEEAFNEAQSLIVEYIHDYLINTCSSADECREAIYKLSVSLDT